MKKLLTLTLTICLFTLYGNNAALFQGEQFFKFRNITEYDVLHRNFTIDLEFSTDNPNEEEMTFISNESFAFGLDQDSKPFIDIGEIRSSSSETEIEPLNDDECHHLAIVRKNGYIFFFVDGVEYSINFNNKDLLGITTLLVGARSPNYDYSYSGYLNNVRFWNEDIDGDGLNNLMYKCVNDYNYIKLILNLQIEEEVSHQVIHDYSFLENHGKFGSQLTSETADPIMEANECFGDDCCTANADFSSTYSTYALNYPIDFFNNSMNASNFSWYVDGIYVSNSFNLSTTISSLGDHVVTLKAKNIENECIDYYSKIITINPTMEFDICGNELSDYTQPESDCPCVYFDPTSPAQNANNYRWFDRFGNKYCNLAIQTNCGTPTLKNGPAHNLGSPNCSTGLFNVYFTGTFTSAQEEIICQVFADLDELLDETPRSASNAPVEFEIRSMVLPSTSTTLGLATSYYDNSSTFSNIIEGEVMLAIIGNNNEAGYWDGYMNINTTFNWYTGYGGTVPNNMVDLYSVTLHEILHSLGFASLISQNGSSVDYGKYGVFDTYLNLDNNTPLISANGTFNSTQVSVANGDLESGCSISGHNVEFRGTSNPLSPVHSPAWTPGSSLSHFESNCDAYATSNYAMNPSIGSGASRRMTQEEVSTLCDLGYLTTTNYGTTNLTAGGGTVPNPNNTTFLNCGIQLFGINDYELPNGDSYRIYESVCSTPPPGIPAFNGSNTVDINEVDLIANDINTTGINGLFDVAGNLIPFVGSSPNRIFTYTYNFNDVINNFIVLNYQPTDGTNIGTETSVLINKIPCPYFECQNPDPCNLICNSQFEGFACAATNFNSTYCFYSLNEGNECDNTSLEGWHSLYSTPDWSDNSTTCTPFDINTSILPFSAGGGNLLLQNAFLPSPYTQTESVITSIEIDQNENYLLSFYYANANINETKQSLGIDIELRNYGDFNNTTGIFDNYPPNLAIPGISQNIVNHPPLNLTSPDHLNWKQQLVSFSPTTNFDILHIVAKSNTGTTVNGYHGLKLDYFELILDEISDIQTNHNILCGQNVVVGDDLCSVKNLTYEWWDVTNTPTRLNEGTTILQSTMLNYDVVLPLGSNGSKLQLNNVSYDVELELRRVTPANGIGSNNIAINGNLDATVSVDINTNSPVLDPSFSEVIKCNTVEFTSNTTTVVTHDWDFGDGQTSNLANPINIYLATGTYTVIHETSSNGCSNSELSIIDIVSVNDFPLFFNNGDVYSMATAPNGDMYFAGSFDNGAVTHEGITISNPQHPSYSISAFLGKYNSCGVEWIVRLPVYSTNPILDIQIDATDNEIYVACSGVSCDLTNSCLTSKSSGIVLKYNNFGTYQECNILESSVNKAIYFEDVIIADNSDVFILADIYEPNQPASMPLNTASFNSSLLNNGPYILKYDNILNEVNHVKINHEIYSGELGISINDPIVIGTGGLDFCAYYSNTNLVKYPNNLSLSTWELNNRKSELTYDFNPTDLCVTSQNHVLSLMSSCFSGSSDLYSIEKVNNTNGLLNQNQSFNFSNSIQLHEIIYNNINNIYVSGTYDNNVFVGIHDYTTLNLSNSIQSTNINTMAKDVSRSLIYDADNIYVGGKVNDGVTFGSSGTINGTGGFITKIDMTNFIFAQKQESNDNATGNEINIDEIDEILVYPNPVKDEFTVKSSAQIVSIRVTDILGREVYNNLPQKEEVKINMSSYNYGLYNVVIETINSTTVKKIVLQN